MPPVDENAPDPLDSDGLNPFGGAPFGDQPFGPGPEQEEEEREPVDGGGGPAGPIFTRRRFRRIMCEYRREWDRDDDRCKRARKKAKEVDRAAYLARVRTALPMAQLASPQAAPALDPMAMLRARLDQADHAAQTARQMQAVQQQVAMARHQAMLQAQRDDSEAQELLMVA